MITVLGFSPVVTEWSRKNALEGDREKSSAAISRLGWPLYFQFNFRSKPLSRES
jgi:hypothetical protein